MVKPILRNYKYPSDLQEGAVELVLEQAQVWVRHGHRPPFRMQLSPTCEFEWLSARGGEFPDRLSAIF